MGWWRDDDALRRVVEDLVAAELTRLRAGGVALPQRPWQDGLAIGADGLGADSLELIELSGALVETLGLAASGREDWLLARRTLGGWRQTCREALALCDDALVFRSSGSTGEPKPCRHTLAALAEEVAGLAALLPAARVVTAVPAHHIYGFLFTVLLPQRLGVPVVAVPRELPAAAVRHLRDGDLVIAHPAWWSGLERAGTALPPGVTGVTSTAPCPPALFGALQARGLARLVEIYGASETAGIGWRDAPGPFTLMAHWSRAADRASLTRGGAGGAPLVQAPPDRLDWLDERRFTVEGRRDGAVQVGGVNVFPAQVRAKLLGHPMVADAAVRLMAPHEGTRLKAFVVLREGVDPARARAALADWIDRALPVPERPRAVTLGDALPTGPLGKLADWPIS